MARLALRIERLTFSLPRRLGIGMAEVVGCRPIVVRFAGSGCMQTGSRHYVVRSFNEASSTRWPLTIWLMTAA